MTWKSVVMTVFNTLKECAGQNRICPGAGKIDRQLGRKEFPRENQARTVGVLRLGRRMWQVGVSDGQMAKQ